MKFKPRDKVRVLDKTIGQSLTSFYTDSKTRKDIILIINKIEQKLLDNQCCVFIWFLNITGGYYFMESDLELVSDKEESTQEEFKYGDIVEVNHYTNIWYKAKFIAYDKDANWKYLVRPYLLDGINLNVPSNYLFCRKYVEPKPDLAMDTPVWVKNSKGGRWVRRHFKEWSGDLMVVWGDGRTSHTKSTYYTYQYWSLTDPTK